MIHYIKSPGSSDAFALLEIAYSNLGNYDTLYLESGNYYLSHTLNWTSQKRVNVVALGAVFQPYILATLNPLIKFGAADSTPINQCSAWLGGYFLNGGICLNNLSYSNLYIEQITNGSPGLHIRADTYNGGTEYNSCAYSTYQVTCTGCTTSVQIDMVGASCWANFNQFVHSVFEDDLGSQIIVDTDKTDGTQNISWLFDKCIFKGSAINIFDMSNNSQSVLRDCYFDSSGSCTIGSVGTRSPTANVILVRPVGPSAPALVSSCAGKDIYIV